MSEIRWTDKVYLDSRGNIHCSTNTDIVTEDIINKIKVNGSLAQPEKEAFPDELQELYRKRMGNILSSPEEVKARWICCPMCDRDICNRNANDCDVKIWLEKHKEAEND